MKYPSITFLVPTRNTLLYTQLAYKSLRQYNPDAEIIILDDLSTDGTLEWLDTIEDSKLIKWKNDPLTFPRTYSDQTFSGHTLTYNIGATLANNDVICAFHSDMVCSPNFTVNLLKHLQPKTIVSGTRIEPPVYRPDKAKLQKNFGIHIEEFKEEAYLAYVKEQEIANKDQTTNGFFAPWAMFTNEYLELGGMDPIFAPWPVEDSDFIWRLKLLGYNILQSRDAFCYHWCSRGHKGNNWMKEGTTNEYANYTQRALQNYFNKWGQLPCMNEYSYPIS